MGELQPAGGLEEEEVEVAAALEVAEDKDNDARQLGTREIRQTEVNSMAMAAGPRPSEEYPRPWPQPGPELRWHHAQSFPFRVPLPLCQLAGYYLNSAMANTCPVAFKMKRIVVLFYPG